uniref:Amiloride-sensitive sodium channel n=1 Tax=Macrostomum lignano TaxID=282301 RepID=A0A1I8JAQ9_9PLAT
SAANGGTDEPTANQPIRNSPLNTQSLAHRTHFKDPALVGDFLKTSSATSIISTQFRDTALDTTMGGERTQRCFHRTGSVSDTARAFLESTSIRGVGKILKSQSKFLRRLWALFVLGSTSLLFYSAFKVTIDYLQYDVNIQTRLDIDDATPFPAVSICNNQPFSERAYEEWSAKRIKSPTVFNRELRQRGLKLMQDPSMPDVYAKVRSGQADEKTMAKFNQQRTNSMKALVATLFMDSSRLYYQNLSPDEAAKLGHERNKSIVDCIFKYNSQQVQGTKGCYDSMIKVTSFSHPNYFNCLTLEFDTERLTEVHSLTLIMWLGPRENYDIRHRQGFLYDIFEQAYGLRVSIHEPYSHPRILEQGIQTEPGKMNEINYQPVRFIRANTPKNPCVSAEDERQSFRKFVDFGKLYAYDQELCLNSRVQEAFLSSCRCLYVEMPSVTPPNKTHPYCAHLDEKIYERAECASTLDQRRIRQAFEASECLPRCQQLSYEKELSVTKWRDTQWMLYWIK